MIKHIVLIKLRKDQPHQKTNELLGQLKYKLDELPSKIDLIKTYETGINISSSANAFDLVLISTFNSIEDLNIYREHPDHVKVLNYINEVKEDIKVVDYEY